MSDQKPANETRSPPPHMTDFGIFYPVGYLVAAFPKKTEAQQVQSDLMTGGYDAADCLLLTSEEVVDAAQQNLAQNTGWLARLGKSDEAVQKHLDAAKQGATFLVIYTPGDTDAARAMNVIRRVPFAFVHRYHRLAIQDMK
jgi:hypothetical protein